MATLLCASAPECFGAQTGDSREYDIKAAFLFNFGQFVSWPADAFPDAGAPFVIGVLGEDPFGVTLDEIVAGEKVSNRPMTIERYHDVTEIRSCQILFISKSETPQLERIFQTLSGRSILTVGEVPGFADHSGIIRFMIVNNKLRLKINVSAARAAQLTISSQLLRQSAVRPEPSGRVW
jgi:hypothetical protein